MAKIEGDQSVPSEWLDLYRGNLNPHPTGNIVKKRYPFRMPRMQAGGTGVHSAQLAQRERFKIIKGNFKNLSSAERARWYAAEPPWSSFLWYYNYFIMSGLVGNADITHGGAGVIKSIQVVKEAVPTTGTKSFAISTVDPAKTVVMVFGNSYISDLIHHYDGVNDDDSEITVNLSPNIDPAIAEIKLTGQGGRMDISGGTGSGWWGHWYVTEVLAASIKIKMQKLWTTDQFGWSIDIIEHKAQTIYPVINSIGASAVVIDWAKAPSVAADVSILVIEYV